MPNRIAAAALAGVTLASNLSDAIAGCQDFRCWGVNICSAAGMCEPSPACPESSITLDGSKVLISGGRCRVTMQDIHAKLPDSVSKSGTEYTLNHKLHIKDDCVLEIHGEERATAGAAVSVLRLKVRGKFWP